jgi:hypothetical protein
VKRNQDAESFLVRDADDSFDLVQEWVAVKVAPFRVPPGEVAGPMAFDTIPVEADGDERKAIAPKAGKVAT